MNKKTAGRISAMAMASMMMMSVCVVNASAEENEPITQLNLKKTVTTDGNTYQPNTSFSFHVENGEAAENWRDNVVYAGVTGGITASQTIGFQPSGEDTLAAAYSKNATLEINTEVFEHAGVYHYVVTEDAGSYEGIDYDTAGRDVYLFVYNGADGALYVGNVITEKSDANMDDIPMVVLVNENSASASEILAGAFKDRSRAKIIGTKTFGKGIVQKLFPLENGAGAKITISEYKTPNNEKINKIGVKPDIEVENKNLDLDLNENDFSKDQQFLKALAELVKEIQ